MKDHPRIRKTVKWTSAAMVVVFVVAWAVSLMYSAVFFGGNRWMIATTPHSVYVVRAAKEREGGVTPRSYFLPTPQPIEHARVFRSSLWSFWWRPGSAQAVAVPYWVPIVLFSVVCALMHRRDRWVNRAMREGLCITCGYDRAGSKDLTAACPECGALPGRT